MNWGREKVQTSSQHIVTEKPSAAEPGFMRGCRGAALCCRAPGRERETREQLETAGNSWSRAGGWGCCRPAPSCQLGGVRGHGDTGMGTLRSGPGNVSGFSGILAGMLGGKSRLAPQRGKGWCLRFAVGFAGGMDGIGLKIRGRPEGQQEEPRCGTAVLGDFARVKIPSRPDGRGAGRSGAG